MKWGVMYEILMEFMEPQLILRDEAKKEEWLQRGVKGTVNLFRKFGIEDSEIRRLLWKAMDFQKKKQKSIFK